MLYPLSYGGSERGRPIAAPPMAKRLSGPVGNTRHTRLVVRGEGCGPHGGLPCRVHVGLRQRRRGTEGRDKHGHHGRGRPREGALRSPDRRPRRRSRQLPRRRQHDDAAAHRGRPERRWSRHRDDARRRRPGRRPPARADRPALLLLHPALHTAASRGDRPRRGGGPAALRPGDRRPLIRALRRPAYAARMPEGHTLFRLAREQSQLFAGRPVHVTSPQGRFEAGATLLDGRVLQEVFSYGKHLFAGFGADVLHVHLGLYGTFTSGAGVPPAPRGALRMRWEGPGLDGTGVWTDLRGPTACEVLAVPEVDRILARLGPDPLRPRADGALA